MKKFMMITVGIFAVIIVGLVIAISMMDLNHYKPKIQEAVKNSSGYDLKIEGDIAVSFSPVGVSVKKVSLSVPEQKAFASFDSFDVALDVMPLLNQELKVNYVVLSNLALMIEKSKKGKFNFEVPMSKAISTQDTKTEESTQKTKESKLALINVSEVRLENANINYIDHMSDAEANVAKLNVVINDINLDSSKEKLKSIALKAKVNIDKIQYNKYNIYDTSMLFELKDAIADMSSMKYTIFDSKASAKARVDLSGKSPLVSIEESIPSLKLENFAKEVLEKDLLQGVVNSTAKLSFVGSDALSIKKTLKGNVLFDGQKAGIKGYDVDKIVKSYNDLKNGDLKKTGTSFLSAALENASKGKGALDSFKGGTTAIERLHVKIDIDNAVASLSDVAIATLNNRVAVKGDINLVNESLKNVNVAILDQKGCASYSQGIEGTLSNPKGKSIASSKISVEQVEEVVGMISSFFGKSKKKEPVKKANEECTVFYNGVVAHP